MRFCKPLLFREALKTEDDIPSIYRFAKLSLVPAGSYLDVFTWAFFLYKISLVLFLYKPAGILLLRKSLTLTNFGGYFGLKLLYELRARFALANDIGLTFS